VNGGDADRVAPGKQSQKSTNKRTQTVNLNAKTATATAKTQQVPKQQATKDATLPQTDEATVSPWIGLALLLGGALTGFVLKRKRQH
jgi:LPXTG-motif cell wall-anchored protein